MLLCKETVRRGVEKSLLNPRLEIYTITDFVIPVASINKHESHPLIIVYNVPHPHHITTLAVNLSQPTEAPAASLISKGQSQTCVGEQGVLSKIAGHGIKDVNHSMSV